MKWSKIKYSPNEMLQSSQTIRQKSHKEPENRLQRCQRVLKESRKPQDPFKESPNSRKRCSESWSKSPKTEK